MCGIWGYASKSANQFSWIKFDWIGVGNDDRGRDACGRVCGNKVEHSNQVGFKKYEEYISVMLPPKIAKNVKAVFGHTRASSRNIENSNNIEYTQPIVHYNKDQEIEYIASHNGTLYNHKELQKEYGFADKKHTYIDKEGVITEHEMNDSQILFYIIGKLKRYDVLSKYYGSAAFALYDYKENNLLLWSGASKMHNYTTESEERPIHILQERNSIWFSSKYNPLSLINYSEKNEIEELKNNVLHFYKDGKLVDTKAFSREGRTQSQKIEPYKSNYNHNSRNPYKKGDCYICEGTGFYGLSTIKCITCKGTGKNEKAKITIEAPKKISKTKDDYFGEELPDDRNELIKYSRGFYRIKGELAHGVIHLDTMGCSHDEKIDGTQAIHEWEVTKVYYFIQGNMMPNAGVFNKWTRKVKRNDDLDHSHVITLGKDTVYPVFNVRLEQMKTGIWDSGWNYTGSFSPLFSNSTYEYLNGMLVETRFNKDNKTNTPDHGILFVEDVSTVNDLPWKEQEETNDHLEEQEDEFESTIRRELKEEIEKVISSAQDARGITFVYSDHKLAQITEKAFDDCISFLSEIKI